MVPTCQHPRRTEQEPLAQSCRTCKDGKTLIILSEATDSLVDPKSTKKEGNGITVPSALLWKQAADLIFKHSTLTTQITCQFFFLYKKITL